MKSLFVTRIVDSPSRKPVGRLAPRWIFLGLLLVGASLAMREIRAGGCGSCGNGGGDCQKPVSISISGDIKVKGTGTYLNIAGRNHAADGDENSCSSVGVSGSFSLKPGTQTTATISGGKFSDFSIAFALTDPSGAGGKPCNRRKYHIEVDGSPGGNWSGSNGGGADNQSYDEACTKTGCTCPHKAPPPPENCMNGCSNGRVPCTNSECEGGASARSQWYEARALPEHVRLWMDTQPSDTMRLHEWPSAQP